MVCYERHTRHRVNKVLPNNPVDWRPDVSYSGAVVDGVVPVAVAPSFRPGGPMRERDHRQEIHRGLTTRRHFHVVGDGCPGWTDLQPYRVLSYKNVNAVIGSPNVTTRSTASFPAVDMGFCGRVFDWIRRCPFVLYILIETLLDHCRSQMQFYGSSTL